VPGIMNVTNDRDVRLQRGRQALLKPRQAPTAPVSPRRQSGRLRGLLIYRSDYRCSHRVNISGDCWRGDVRLSDTDDRFVCRTCGIRGADVSPDLAGDGGQIGLS